MTSVMIKPANEQKDRSTIEVSRKLHRRLRGLAHRMDRRIRDVTDEVIARGLASLRRSPESESVE